MWTVEKTIYRYLDGRIISEWYSATDVDALLADVRRLVEATMEWHSVDDCHAEGRSDCRLCKAIAAVERNL